MMKHSPVPVIMYHSIGLPVREWKWNFLTYHYKYFESHLRWLHKFNFQPIDLNELYGYIFEGRKIPKRSIVLTFDDGYVDNWVFAFPLLKKYNYKGTIFVNPDFIDKNSVLRKRLDEVRHEREIPLLDRVGFLSWPEMKEMERSGVIDIQSHALTHTWYPVSDKIIDFRHPGDDYIWMTWNNHKEMKPYLQIDKKELISHGEPVYEHKTSLSSPRYFPDKGLRDHVVSFVAENGDLTFFQKSTWRSVLHDRVKSYSKQNTSQDGFESIEEYKLRIRYELEITKKILESELSKKINFLCWPGDSGTSIGVEIAQEIGYRWSTAARDIQHLRKQIKNCPPQTIQRVQRISPGFLWRSHEDGLKAPVYKGGAFLLLEVLRFQKKYLSQFWGRVILKIVNMWLDWMRRFTS